MKQYEIKLLVVLLWGVTAVSCQSPFFGDQLKSEHIEEEVYVPPQYDKVVPPLNVTATQNEIDQIIVTWSKVATAAGYRIYRSEDPSTGFELLSEVSATDGLSSESGSGSEGGIPAAGSEGTGENTDETASGTNADNGTDSGTESVSSDMTFSDNGSRLPLKSGFTYYYRISSLNTENVESSLTEAVAGRCYLTNGDVVPPAVVTASKGSYGDRILLSWDAVAKDASYRIYRTESENVPVDDSVLIATTESGINFYEDADTVLKAGQIYYYRIQTIGQSGNPGEQPPTSVLSTAVFGYLADPSVPEVTGLTATTNDSEKVYLTWNPVSYPVRIYRSDSESGTYEVLADVAEGGEYADLKSSGNLKEKEYFYKIQAVKSEAETGILSAPVKGHVEIRPPEIVLTGGEVVIDLNRSRVFNDPGFSASDNFDGDLTSYCLVDESAIDFTKRGVWTVTYSVTDAAGQTTTVERKVKTIFLPNLDNADIVLVSKYAAAGQQFVVEVRGIQPAEVPAELETSYSYGWAVESGSASGNSTQGSLLVKASDAKMFEKEVTVTVSTADGSVNFSKPVQIYPDVTVFGNTFPVNGQFGSYRADYYVRLRTAVASWTCESGSALSGDYVYGHWGGGDPETLISVLNGEFVMNNIETDTSNWAGVGDKADSAVRLYSPEFDVFANVTYRISFRVYRESGSKADVFLRVVSGDSYTDFATSKQEGWSSYSFDYVAKADGTLSLQIYKMPSGVKDWGAVTENILYTSCDSKEVRIDDIAVTYKN